MNSPTIPTCPLGLTEDDLSAWRDEALPASEQARVAAHVRSCRACQRTIAAYEALGAALRSDQPPAPDPRNWPMIQARIAGGQTTMRPATPRPARRLAPRAALWGGLSAVAAVLILTGLFFSLFRSQTAQRRVKTEPLATPAPVEAQTPTLPIKGGTLAWNTYAAPAAAVPPLGNQELVNNFAFAPNDARTAYICAAQNSSGANPVSVWATHNGAQSWTLEATLPNSDQIAGCYVSVDAQNPLRLNLFLGGQSLAPLSSVPNSYLSDDGGRSWRALSKPAELDGISTRGQTSVAIAWTIPESASQPNGVSRLVVSHDDFHTWAPIDSALTAKKLSVSSVWQRPSDGALLAMASPITKQNLTSGFPNITYQLWQSTDMGAHWSEFSTPANLHNFPGFIAAQPQGAEPWRVCGLSLIRSSTVYSSELIACTLDGGQTWTSRPLPATGDTSCPSCSPWQVLELPETTFLDNGEIVSVMFPNDGSQQPHLIALPAGSSEWRDLGALPGLAFIVINGGARTTAVAYSGASYVGPYSGDLVGQIGGDVPYRGDLSFATLP